MVELISVPEAARRLHVSGERVRQRIHDGSLPAELVAGRWLVSADSLDSASSASRPLSPRIAWGLLDHLAGCALDQDLSRSERARIRRYAERLREHSDAAWQLRSWLRHRADRQLYQAAAGDLVELREHPALIPSGVSCELAGIVAEVVEGYVRRADLEGLVDDFFLVGARGRDANVVLHVVDGELPASLEPSVLTALTVADLADYAAPRESARAVELLTELAK